MQAGFSFVLAINLVLCLLMLWCSIEVQVDVNNVEEVDTSRFDENPDEADQLPQEGEGPQYLPHFSVTVANSQVNIAAVYSPFRKKIGARIVEYH